MQSINRMHSIDRSLPTTLHILHFKMEANNMVVSVDNDFDSYECLKCKVAEIEHNSDCIFCHRELQEGRQHEPFIAVLLLKNM